MQVNGRAPNGKWTFGVVTILAGLAAVASPARAQYLVPDDCLTGEGFYEGDLVGDCEYDTATFGGAGDEFEFTFFGELAEEYSDGDLDIVTFTDIEIDEDGFFAFIAEDEFTGNLIDVEGFFFDDDCTIEADYILDISDSAVEFIGDIFMEADPVFIPDPDDDDDDGPICTAVGFVDMS
ncbi:MAG TPA: hypothetical protein VNT79_03185, partial [Phycisphaerae bacterium]|nr:hypothetical protein [Phycisphaerae bacterium]